MPIGLQPLPPLLAGFRASQRRRPPRAPLLSPEEEQSLIRSLGSKALGGITTVAALEDIPGGAFRNILTGQMPSGRLASFEGRATGRDVLEHWGLAPRNRPGFHPIKDPIDALFDVAGFGVEVGTDPFAWGTGGAAAVGRAGKLARAAGLTKLVQKAAGKGVGKRLARLTGTLRPALKLGGKPAQEAAERAAAKMGIKLADVIDEPLGGLKMLFHRPSGGKYGKYAQEVAELRYGGLPEARVAAHTTQHALETRYGEAFKAFDDAYGPIIRGETSTGVGPRFAEAIGLKYDVGDIVRAADRENFGRVQKIMPKTARVWFRNPKTGAVAVKQLPHEQLTLSFKKGTTPAQDFAREQTLEAFDKLAHMTGETTYEQAFRWTMPKGAVPSPEVGRAIEGAMGNVRQANKSLWTDLRQKGGTAEFLPEMQQFEHLPRYAALKKRTPYQYRELSTRAGSMIARREAIQTVPKEIANRIARDPKARGPGAAEHILGTYGEFLGDSPRFPSAEEHATRLAEWAAEHPKALVTKKQDILTMRTMDEEMRYLEGGHRASATVDAIHEHFRMNLVDDGMEVSAAFRRAGMKDERAIEHFAKVLGESVDDVRTLKIRSEAVDAAVAIRKLHVNQEWAEQLGKTLGKAMQWFRNNLTIPFPAFWVRNFNSGQVVNMVFGDMASPKDVAVYLKQFGRARRVARGMEPDVLRQAQMHNLIGMHQGFEEASSFRLPGESLAPGRPFDIGSAYRGAVQHVADEPGLLGRVPGGRQAQVGYRTYMTSAARVNQQVEWYNRVPMWLYLQEKGYTPAAAARRVLELQFDYSHHTAFEATVVRPFIVPFYVFTKGMAGLMTRTLMERPGGLFGQILRGTARARGAQPILPPYIAETSAIPLPPGPGGADRYLTGMGMAWEDVTPFLGQGAGAAGLETLSRMNPMIKGPLEYLTGQTFFQRGPRGGRPLEALDPTLGRLIANITGRERPVATPKGLEVLSANLPTSRYLTSARTLTDPRKGWLGGGVNLLTGWRISDVPERAKDRVLKEALAARQAELGAIPFEKQWFPEEVLGGMDAETRQQAMEMQAISAMLRRRQQARSEVGP